MRLKAGPSTRCVHYGRAVDPKTHAMNMPIYENADVAADYFSRHPDRISDRSGALFF